MTTSEKSPAQQPPAANASFSDLFNEAAFVYRHLGSDDAKQAELLSAIGYDDMASFIDAAVPAPVRMHNALDLPLAMSEHAALAKLRAMADNITVNKSYIGQGYAPVRMPAVIQRNVLENPGWYTAYTPYQAEIAQGRLEALLNFQQVCIDLTGLELAFVIAIKCRKYLGISDEIGRGRWPRQQMLTN